MEVSREEVEHVAMLARLALAEDEVPFFQRQLGAILTEVEKMRLVETEGVPPTSHVIPRTNVFRSDVPVPGLSRDSVMSNAPVAVDGRYSVPTIVESES
jgi:aspartyl-tRNA(Asn)/glutamyl-tRNA(Gln) amidotransferase subunit C